MKIIIMLETITTHDAIGNDVELMYKLLIEKYECMVYARTQKNPNVKYVTEDELNCDLQDKENIIIFHHSTYWEKGVELIENAKCRIIFRYHNITPENFFKPYNQMFYDICRMGRMQTLYLQKRFPNAFWVCDSYYNMNDIYLIPDEQKDVCPPFNKIDSWKDIVPDDVVRENLKSDSVKLLFVSRVVPNKGHSMLLDVVKYYVENYDNKIELNIIGKFDENLKKYTELIKKKIDLYALEKNVNLIGEMTDEKLSAFYRYSDVFVSCSEHEGFFVPAVEAQYFRLPVIALRAGAVEETMGEEQLIFGHDPAQMAAAIHVICTNDSVKNTLETVGYANYENRFSYERIKACFEAFFDRFLMFETKTADQKKDEKTDQKENADIMKLITRAASQKRYYEILEEVENEIEAKGIPMTPSISFEHIVNGGTR